MRTVNALSLVLALGTAFPGPLAHAAGPMPGGLSEQPGDADLPTPLPLEAPTLCQAEPVLVYRGKGKPSEPTRMALTLCDGRPNPEAARLLTVLSRPDRATPEAAPGSLEPELLTRLQAIASHYEGQALELVSGYRPRARSTSRHAHGAAVDLRVHGVDNAELARFARSLAGTGVGYYPNSSFVHIDVRDASYYWVDRSGPGERADYVRAHAGVTDATDADADFDHADAERADPNAASAELDQPADLTLGLEEVEAYLAQAEVTSAMDAPRADDATEAEAVVERPAPSEEAEPLTDGEPTPANATVAALDLPAPAADSDALAVPVAALEEPPATGDAVAAPAASEPAAESLPDPELASTLEAAPALALESDPELLALAQLGPPTGAELSALASRAVHAVLAALPAPGQLDSRLPTR